MHHGSLLGLLGGWMHHGSLLGLLGGWMHHGSLLGLLGGWMHHGSLLGLLGGWMHHGSLLGLLGGWMHHGSLLGLLGGWTFCHSDPGNTSRVQKYVGFGEFGIRNADHYNNKAWKMAIRKAGDYLPIQCKILQTEHFGKNSASHCQSPPDQALSLRGAVHAGVQRSRLLPSGGEGELAERRAGDHHSRDLHRHTG
ncbi:uncharacterized protein LOC127915162 isoform X2 [Oncorhynchus keta]|uniref:uncharacterized protein LOC127915162 isoform X2 n=1 Tax=Oncorhynchus keta TaxID=8018 RepID=UPI00227A7243|nr:uncharacterized protein LOC127915162 isoform X2 [Oncorhynchus keta]